jgi:hypothetical protein
VLSPSSEYLPRSHSIQTSFPERRNEYFPGEQGKHDVAAETLEKKPSIQNEQFTLPELSEKNPVGHGVHSISEPELKKPG